MAEHTLQARLILRYGTIQEWNASQLVLAVGEMAVCYFPNTNTILPSDTWPNSTPPAIGLKVGNGSDTFNNLPWVQAVAADVYEWAKNSRPPSANSIPNLSDYLAVYLEEHGITGGGGSGSGSVSRQYQIIQGTNDDINKYYLRYKNDDSDTWIVDTSHYIDLSDYKAIEQWIGPANISSYINLRTYIGRSLVQPIIESLTVTDNETENGFVTSVSEENGVISTTKRQPRFSNLAGSATVEQGGTGKTELPENSVLIGNGTNPIRSIPLSTTIDDSLSIAPTYLMKAYIDNSTAGLTSAMHWVGASSVPINGPTDPQISDYDFSKAKKGDVITWNTSEYVWTGSTWRLIGDEGSYVIKGSITNSDIDPQAAIALTKIAGLLDLLSTKVDKETGKQLSTNDYSNEDKAKLDGIQQNAQQNVIEHITVNGREYPATTVDDIPKVVALTVQEFDDDDRAKLNRIDSMEDGAQRNKIESITIDGSPVTIDTDRTATIITNPHTEHINVIEHIFLNGQEELFPTTINNQAKSVNINIDEAAQTFQVINGARYPVGRNTYENVNVIDKKLDLARIAVTGNVDSLLQTTETFIILDCGTSNSDKHDNVING